MRQREPGMASGAQTLKNGVARGVGARINQARGGGIKRRIIEEIMAKTERRK
jgi:hypothetical protein